MANKQTLPNQVDVRGSYINTNGAPQMPSINYKSPLRDVAGVVDYANQFVGTYTKLRNEQYEAQGVGLMNRMAHEMEDAKDPCELQDIKNAYDQQLNEIGGDDLFAKNYRNSQYFQNFKNKWNLNTEKLYLNKMHDFENIAAVSAGQEIANTLANAQSSEDINAAIQAFNSSLSEITHLSADHKYKLLSNMISSSLGNVVANNPQVAEDFINRYGEHWGKFGLDTADVATKIDNRKRAMRAEARREEAHQRALIKEAREAETDRLKASIIKNPENAEAIIAEAGTIDDKMFVNLSDWYRKGIGKQKASTQSPYVKGFVEAEDKEAYIKENLEAIGDPKYRAAVNFYYQKVDKKATTSAEKEEEANLQKGMRDAAEESQEAYESFVDEHFADIAMYGKARAMQTTLDKRFGIKEDSYLDLYMNDLNSMDLSIEDVKAERARLQKNTLLSAADKNKVYKTLSTIESKLNSASEKAERKADKEAAAEVKEQEKVAKEESAQALNEVYAQVPNGAEAVNEAYLNNLSKMNTADRGKAIKQINTLIREEAKGDAKAQTDTQRQQQARNYMTLNNQIINGTLNDPNVIEQAAEDGLITPQNAVKLENKLHELNVKQSKADEKGLIDQDKLLIYSNAEKGIVTPINELKSGNAEVIRARNIEANKITENNYKKRRAEITSEIYDNLPDEETQRGYVNNLTRLNVSGTHTPEQDVQKVISQVSNSDFDKFKNLKTKLFAFMGAPLSGKNYSAYEMELRNAALDEAHNFAKDKGRAPTEEELSIIAGKYMPTKEGLNQYRDTRESAYYNLLSERNSLFEPVTDKSGNIKVSTYRLNAGYKFSDFDSYTRRLEQARDKISDSEYKELYKPVALYMGDIIRRAQSDDTVESYAMKSLLKQKYSNRIDDPAAIYDDYRKLMGIIETEGAERRKTVGNFFTPWKYTRNQVDEAVQTLFKNSQQLQGNGVRN